MNNFVVKMSKDKNKSDYEYESERRKSKKRDKQFRDHRRSKRDGKRYNSED